MNFIRKKKMKENTKKITIESLVLEVKELQEQVIKLQNDKIALLEVNNRLKKEKIELKRKEKNNERSKN